MGLTSKINLSPEAHQEHFQRLLKSVINKTFVEIDKFYHFFKKIISKVLILDGCSHSQKQIGVEQRTEYPKNQLVHQFEKVNTRIYNKYLKSLNHLFNTKNIKRC